jgi:integrase
MSADNTYKGYRLGWHRGARCVVWYEDGKRRRYTLGTTDPGAARQGLKAFADARERRSFEHKEPTVGELFEAYATYKDEPRIFDAWKSLGAFFSALVPAGISEETCKAYVEARQMAGIQNGTIHTELTYLAAALASAQKKRILDRAPHIYKPPKPEARDRHLSYEEARALLAAVELPHMKLAIRLLLGTAGRVGAILDLTWDRIDFERGLIHLHNPERGETRKGRATVPMTHNVRQALMQAKEGALTGHVIEWAGKPVKSIKKGFATAVRKAGLKDVRIHDLRRTAAVWMAEDRVPFEEIAQYLGHTDTRTTYKNYARFSPEYLKKAAGALEI